jgi:hypothetical protein
MSVFRSDSFVGVVFGESSFKIFSMSDVKTRAWIFQN